jgi:RNA polymerase sigma-70 factor (ECF subfamily)
LERESELINDHHLLEQYFHEYFEVLHRYAYTLLKDNDDAKDVVQSVFTQLWQKREALTIRQSARAYLYAATHNHCLNRIKSEKIRQNHHSRFAANEDYTTTGEQEQLTLKDLKKEVLSAMDAIPEKCREIFYKSRFEEKSYQEIAKELGISVKTVEAQMGKALRILRTTLSGNAYWLIICCHLFTEINKLPHSLW